MGSEPPFELPQRAADPHEFPTNREDWYTYRRWLARYGTTLEERLESAPTLPEREAARREWEAICELTDRAEQAYQEFLVAQEDAEYADYAQRLANRIWTDWVSQESVRPRRDTSRHALTALAFDGPDDEGRRLSAAMYRLDSPDDESRVLRLPRANVLALTAVLEEFAARLMLARADGDLVEGDDYIRVVVALQADLESRRFGE